MNLSSHNLTGLFSPKLLRAADSVVGGRPQIERQGILKGYRRIDDLWAMAQSCLARTYDRNSVIEGITGFSEPLLRKAFEEQFAESCVDKWEEEAAPVRLHLKQSQSQILDQQLSVAAAVVCHRMFLSGQIRIWHQPGSGAERYLTRDEFRVAPHGAWVVYGQALNAETLATPYDSWMTGNASLSDTNGRPDDWALYGKTLMVSDEDFKAAGQQLLRDFPPSPAALADDENNARFDRDLPGWTERLFAREQWSYGEALWWIALRDPRLMAERLLRQTDYYEGKGTGWVAAMVAVTITPDENADTASEDFSAKDGTIVCFTPITSLNNALLSGAIRASGLFEDGGKRELIDSSYWHDLDLIDGPSRVDHRSMAIRRNRIKHEGMSLEGCWFDLLFSRDDLLRAFPTVRDIPGLTASKSDSPVVATGDWALDEAPGNARGRKGSPKRDGIVWAFQRLRADNKMPNGISPRTAIKRIKDLWRSENHPCDGESITSQYYGRIVREKKLFETM